MHKIAIFQSDLRVGGIQKALLNTLNEIDYNLCEVHVFLYDEEAFFDAPERKNLHFHFSKPFFYAARLTPFKILRRLPRFSPSNILSRFSPEVDPDIVYDVAVDFNSYRNECAVGALSVRAKKRVMWIHNDMEMKIRGEPKYRILWHFFKAKFQYFDEFVAVSPGIIEGFRRKTGLRDKKVTAIPNHVDTREIFEKVGKEISFRVDPNCYNLCTMGRLCHQKGFDILLGFMAQVAPARPDMRLYILGDGPDRAKLEAQIRRLKLGGVVTLLGNQKNPFPYLDRMDGFVLTSRYEGQGIVIWEAKALGLELFISKNLEKYNPGVDGREDLPKALISAQKHEKIRDELEGYNKKISQSINELLELDK
ncbi:MAG: glycosyltransferase [Oscillospiraceae bacterium]|nr:glycosyltransferase [Oscillospiraceae bacterium]